MLFRSISHLLSFVTSATAGYEGQPISPDIIEVTQIDGETETKIEASNKQLTVPEEKGTYYYNVYAEWEEQINGEAYYAFKITVL